MLKQRIRAASKAVRSDLVIEDIHIVDVFTQEIYTADVAVAEGCFVGIGDYKGQGKKKINGKDKFIIPGFVDAHAHIESTLVTPVEYSNASLPHGITSVIADPHEIANVCGIEGIKFMIENASHVPMDIFFMLPSCVPATSFENSGAILSADDLKPLYSNPQVAGLAEVMDFPAVLNADPDMLKKLEHADSLGKTIDGHGAGFEIDQLNAYAAARIRSDHECDTQKGLIDRARRGIYTLVREGTVCRDLLKMLPAINEKNSRMLCFSTDDKHLDDLLVNGGLNINVRLAVENGLDPVTAIQMATLNAARCYRLDNKGAIAPGYIADFSIVDDLETINIEQVYKDGKLVAENNRIIQRVDPGVCPPRGRLVTSIHIPEITAADLAIDMEGSTTARVIEVVEGSVVSNHLVEPVDVENNRFKINVGKDQLKIAVIERHRNLGNIAVGIIKGLKLKQGAIATTVAHDSHNLIVVGTSDEDMIAAIEAVRAMQGGIVIADKGSILKSLKLEVAGLITARHANEVMHDLSMLKESIGMIAPQCRFNPFLALSFMSLVVIPWLKICDQGVFDFKKFSFVKVPVQDM